MVTVSDDVTAVEIELVDGRLGCPGCGGRLRPWGRARARRVRESLQGTGPVVEHHPRRARCQRCRATHVLLPCGLAARRADGAAVIAAAVEAKVATGQGHRAIARRLGRPASTVRGWLRSFTASAEAIAAAFTALIARHAADAAALWPAAAGEAVRQALAVLGAWARALAGRLGVVELAWQQAAMGPCRGWLFSAPWWARATQHELALTGQVVGPPASR